MPPRKESFQIIPHQDNPNVVILYKKKADISHDLYKDFIFVLFNVILLKKNKCKQSPTIVHFD